MFIPLETGVKMSTEKVAIGAAAMCAAVQYFIQLDDSQDAMTGEAAHIQGLIMMRKTMIECKAFIKLSKIQAMSRETIKSMYAPMSP